MMTNKVISYTRFSHTKQATGSTLDRQEGMIATWLRNNPDAEYIKDLSFEDLGVSGYRGTHAKSGGMSKLLAAAEAGKLTGFTVLVESIDRLSRQAPLDALDVFRRICSSDVSVYTLEDNTLYNTEAITNDPSKLIVLAAKVSMANQYSANLSRRVKGSYDARRKAAANGEQPNIRYPWWFTKGGELIPEKVRVLVELFEESANGKGERQLYSLMTKRMGQDIPYADPSGIKRMLSNRKAIGEWEGHRCLPQAVSDDLWYATQESRLGRRPSKMTQSRTWGLSGLVYCGVCDVPMIVKPDASAPAMACQTRARMGKGTEGTCPHEGSYGYIVLDFLRAAHELDALFRASKRAGDTDKVSELITLRGRLVEQQDAMAGLIKVLEKGYVEAIANRAHELQEGITELEGRIALTEARTDWKPTMDPNDLTDAANELSVLDKCRMLQLADLKIIIHKDRSIECEGYIYSYAPFDRKRKGYPLVCLTTGEEHFITKD